MTKYARLDENTLESTLPQGQILKDHIDGVTKRCLESQIPNFEATSELIGLTHDVGKYAKIWQDYLIKSSRNSKSDAPHEPITQIAHSPYGAYYLTKKWEKIFFPNQQSNAEKELSQFSLEVLQYVILAHHGIFDAFSPKGHRVLEQRVNNFSVKYEYNYAETEKEFESDFSSKYIKKLIIESQNEIKNYFLKTYKFFEGENTKNKFPFWHTLGILTRMLLSTLIDSDWSDAAAYYRTDEEDWQKIYEKFDWQSMIDSLEDYLKSFPKISKMDLIRQEISNECLQAASRKTGIYKLDIPTGSGKTLSAMRFALTHAKLNNKKRIIYTAPYKSIINQNAAVYRKALLGNNLNNQLLLEHHGDVMIDKNILKLLNSQNHSNFEKKPNKQESTNEFNSLYDYLTSTWEAPIILTTQVQLLHTFFKDRSASIRRFHALTNSVLIVDEFQSIPIRAKSLFNIMINVLSEYFGTTVILCTATQPPFENTIKDKNTGYSIVPINYAEYPNLVRNYKDDKIFQRTMIRDIRTKVPLDIDRFANFIQTRISTSIKSLLIVLNTKYAVQMMYQTMIEKQVDGTIIALSNTMIPVHLSQQIKKIENHLDDIKKNVKVPKLIVISTSLIEAGVDLSFEEVIRSYNGLDIITQAAGRCGRNGELNGIGNVWIVHLAGEIENISKMKDLKIAQESTFSTLYQTKKINQKTGDTKGLKELGLDNSEDVANQEQALDIYYRNYLPQLAKETHYPDDENEDMTLFDLLGENKYSKEKYKNKHLVKNNQKNHFLNQAFKTAGEKFEAFDDESIRIFIPWKQEGNDLLIKLNSDLPYVEKEKLLTLVERYSVGVMPWKFCELRDQEDVFPVMDEQIYSLSEMSLKSLYSDDLGLILKETSDNKKADDISFIN